MQQNKTTLVQLLITDLQHSASKRGGLILQRSRAHTGFLRLEQLAVTHPISPTFYAIHIRQKPICLLVVNTYCHIADLYSTCTECAR